MRFRVAQLIVALLLGTCAWGQAVYPLKVSGNHRYLVDQNNQPFLLMADAGHHLIPVVPQSSWNAYLSDRKANGFTAVDVYGTCAATNGTCPANGAAQDGTLPFTSGTGPSNYDLSTPNNTYWSEVDTLVADAASYGLVVILNPLPWGNDFSTTIVNNGSTKDYNFGAYIGNRYKNSPNIMYMLGDDFDQSSFPSDANIALMAQIMAGIKSADPNHLVTCQLNYNLSWSSQANSHSTTYASNLTFNLLYDYFQMYDGAYSAWNQSTLPIWMGEANYETANNTGALSQATNAFITRLQSWYTMTSGGAGFEFGNEHINHFDSGYASSLDTTATLQQKYIGSLFQEYPWQTFAPDQTHTVVTAGYGTYSASDLNLFDANYVTTTWDSHNNAIIYAPASTTMTVNLAAFSTSVNAYWFDPTTGITTMVSGSPFTSSGTHNFTSPAAHSDTYDDWVLVLTTLGRPSPPTGLTLKVN